MISFLSEIAAFQYGQQNLCTHTDPGALLSTNITSFHAGVMPSTKGAAGVNVVPDQATATLDMRVPAAMSMKDAEKMINDMLYNYPTITYEVLAKVDDYQCPEIGLSAFHQALRQSIEKTGLTTKPLYFEATTDLRYYLGQSIGGFGLTPFTVKENLHGINEFVTIEDLKRGTTIIQNLIEGFCA